MLRTSKRAYFRWSGTLILVLFGTLLAYIAYDSLPQQVESQIALCLMIGAGVWVLARLGELLVRRIEVDFTGLYIRTLFTNEVVPWDQVMHLDWWRGIYRSARYTNYRLQTPERQTIAALSDDAWMNLPEGIDYAAAATFGQTLAVLLYTPLLEIIVSSIVFKVQGTWKKRRLLPGSDSVSTDVE